MVQIKIINKSNNDLPQYATNLSAGGFGHTGNK